MIIAAHRRKWQSRPGRTFFLLVFFTAIAASSCEKGGPGPALGIIPSYATVTTAKGYIVLTVSSGTDKDSFPLEWTVSNPYLGRIIRSDGLRATYARLRPNGWNRVTVKDQHGVEGIAVIYQIE